MYCHLYIPYKILLINNSIHKKVETQNIFRSVWILFSQNTGPEAEMKYKIKLAKQVFFGKEWNPLP